MTVDADCTVQLDSALDNKYFSLNYKDFVPWLPGSESFKVKQQALAARGYPNIHLLVFFILTKDPVHEHSSR